MDIRRRKDQEQTKPHTQAAGMRHEDRKKPLSVSVDSDFGEMNVLKELGPLLWR